MTPDALQRLIRHKSYSTTQRNVNISQRVNRVVVGRRVPDVLKQKRG